MMNDFSAALCVPLRSLRQTQIFYEWHSFKPPPAFCYDRCRRPEPIAPPQISMGSISSSSDDRDSALGA